MSDLDKLIELATEFEFPILGGEDTHGIRITYVMEREMVRVLNRLKEVERSNIMWFEESKKHAAKIVELQDELSRNDSARTGKVVAEARKR